MTTTDLISLLRIASGGNFRIECRRVKEMDEVSIKSILPHCTLSCGFGVSLVTERDSAINLWQLNFDQALHSMIFSIKGQS
jgi:hypothetical protein